MSAINPQSQTLSRPSRRAVVRTAAWSVPVVTAATTAPAFAASPCETLYSYRLNWLNAASNYVHVAGAPNQATATIASTNGGPTIYASFATEFFGAGVGDGNINDATNGESRNLSVPSGTAGSNATRDPAITNLGGIGGTNGTARGVRLQEASPAGYANRQELTVTFRSGTATGPVINVRGLSFYVVDIDAITNSPYSDRVVLSPTVAPANQTRDSAVVGDGTYVAESSNAVGPWRNSTANNNQPENQSGARVQVNYPSTTAAQFSSFKLTYWTNTGTGQYHRIYLSDFVFNSTACL